MSTHKKIDAVCVIAILLTVALTVLFMNGEALGITPVVGDAADELFTSNDLDAGWDTSSATEIALSDDGTKINGNGAYVYNGDVYIVYAGRYVLTGGLTDGSVIIDAEKTDKIWLSLNGASIHCEDGAALRVEQADKVFLTLADGTESTLSSGAEYDAELAASGVDGAVYSRDDLTINGSGALAVSGSYKHGIVCNDDLVITGGGITVTAVQDGIHANDSVRIREANLSISAGDDGITVSNDDETAFLYVESGQITIADCYEGLEAIDITIAGGTIDITASDDGINANGSGERSVIRVTGGDITITNPTGRDGDGLDSNGSIYIEGGRLFISVSDSGGNCALDYGSENGGECVVSGGTVIACGGSAMAEGFDAASPQGFLMYTTSAAAGTAIRLEDADGRELLSGEIPCGFSSVVLSAPGLRVGDVCTLTVGGTQEQVTIDNTASAGFTAAGMFGGRGFGRQDMEPPEQSEGGLPLDGLAEPPDGADSFGGQRQPDGMGRPDDMEAPDGMELPDGTELPGGMELPDNAELPGSGTLPEPGNSQETGGRPFGPSAGQDQGRFPQQNEGQLPPAGDGSPSSFTFPVETLILLGVSALALLAGLAFAVKFRR